MAKSNAQKCREYKERLKQTGNYDAYKLKQKQHKRTQQTDSGRPNAGQQTLNATPVQSTSQQSDSPAFKSSQSFGKPVNVFVLRFLKVHGK